MNDSNFFIPIIYTTSKVKNFKDVRVDNWLTDNVIVFKLKDLGNKDDWIIFNTNILGKLYIFFILCDCSVVNQHTLIISSKLCPYTVFLKSYFFNMKAFLLQKEINNC